MSSIIVHHHMVVEVFVNRINALDEEIGALTELKRITNDFLQTMLKNGVTKISALPILYEQMEKQLDTLESVKSMNYTELSALSDKLAKPLESSIFSLPSMRVLSSVRKNGTSDPDGFWRWVQMKRLPHGEPGQHERFEFQTEAGDVFIQRVPDDFTNDSVYLDFIFDGGLFATVNVYLDEDLGERFRSLVKSFDNNKFYEVDYTHEGELRHPAILENLISSDDKRELVALLVPVKKRMADPSLYGKPDELTNITFAEIEAANPVIWEVDVELNKMTQIQPGNAYFHINDNGEAEFIGWVIRAALNTNVSVKLPFRVDMEFRLSGKGKTGINFYYSEETGYHSGGNTGSRSFGINRGNSNEQMTKAIHFHQPIFWDGFNFPGRGAIKKDELTRLTWIVGDKYLAVIINGEIRYCGTNFPYMSLDLSREKQEPIVIGAHGNDKIYFNSIRVSQLAYNPKNKLKKEELIMITKQSNNIIPIIHRLVTDEYGENYWFNGCAKYVMECLGEPDYDYWFFAGITGDIFTQHYTYTKYSGDALSSYMMEENPVKFTEETFAKCGYAATFVSNRELLKNTEMYLQTLIGYIDKGIPVIIWGNPLGVIVGYEDYGKVLLYITGNNNQPERITLDKLLEGKEFLESNKDTKDYYGWIFVGDKKENIPLAQIYRNAITDIPQHFSIKTDTYCFGAEAFRKWAEDIENGKFDDEKEKFYGTGDEFDTWAYHTNYVCVLATNSGCGQGFMQKAQDLNPDFNFIKDIRNQYKITSILWNGNYDANDTFIAEYVKSNSDTVAANLEAIGGGFNVTFKALQDKQHREKIAATIRKFADCMDEVMRILRKNLLEGRHA